MLRGINVSGRNRLAMADLQQVFVDADCRDVVTYIQSGNVVFTMAGAAPPPVAVVQQRLRDMLGSHVPVLVRSGAELRRVLGTNPFARRGDEPAHLHVTFLAAAPDRAGVASLPAGGADGDELAVVGREVYLHCPNGYGNTKLTNALFEKKLGVDATTRNWRTVMKLVDMAGG
jgi:uncharacterized protein (DUF1697 family)